MATAAAAAAGAVVGSARAMQGAVREDKKLYVRPRTTSGGRADTAALSSRMVRMSSGPMPAVLHAQWPVCCQCR